MTILAIETSTSVCSAAWCINGQAVASRISTEGSNHASLLPTFIDELIKEGQEQGWKADAVAVSEGPGSYTGLRIGLSTAKGLCYGWDVPLIPIPTLDILCQQAIATHTLPEDAVLLPMIDARRMEVYTALYNTQLQRTSSVMAQVVEDGQWLPINRPIYYFGDGAAKCQTVLTLPHIHFLPDIIPHAAYMGVLAEQAPSIPAVEMAYYTPFYLKEFIPAPTHVKGLK